MDRCLQLAAYGAGRVAPNPMVGAVLVHEDTILGEGYHRQFGKAHAEVNCIASVADSDRPLIEKGTLYVSLEPCSHFGKTPPCTDLILEQRIKRVVIGCPDVFEKVNGSGITRLQAAGVDVVVGVLEQECKDINRRFFTFHEQKRPYIILKWAQSANGKIGLPGKRVFISNNCSNRLVHKWRSEEAAILVGKTTVVKDDPVLTTRLWNGKSPVRIVLDPEVEAASFSRVFNGDARTIIYNLTINASRENVEFIALKKEDLLPQVLKSLYENDLQSVLVEGGAKTLQSFIDSGLWDEARVITNPAMFLEAAVAAPEMKDFQLAGKERCGSDTVTVFSRK